MENIVREVSGIKVCIDVDYSNKVKKMLKLDAYLTYASVAFLILGIGLSFVIKNQESQLFSSPITYVPIILSMLCGAPMLNFDRSKRSQILKLIACFDENKILKIETIDGSEYIPIVIYYETDTKEVKSLTYEFKVVEKTDITQYTIQFDKKILYKPFPSR